MSYLYGMPTLIECDNLEENLRLCSELELDFVELNMNLFQYQPQNMNVKETNQLLDKYQLSLTLHMPEDLDIGHFNETILNAYFKVFRESVQFAKQTNIKIINMHMSLGIFFKMPDRKILLYEKYSHKYLENIRRFRDLVDEELEGSNIVLTIENTGIYDNEFIQDSVLELLKSDYIKLTYDLGHDYSSGHKDKDFMYDHKKDIAHYHLHDGIGRSNHLPLFEGEMNLEYYFDIIKKHKGRLVFETKTIVGLKKSVTNYRQKEEKT